jgi:hypothetical protein
MSNETSPGTLLTVLAAIPGVGILVGIYLNWRKSPAEVRLITAQADAQEAARDRTRVESESLAAEIVYKALVAAEARINELVKDKQELRAEREYWQRRAEKCERRPLEIELEELPDRER